MLKFTERPTSGVPVASKCSRGCDGSGRCLPLQQKSLEALSDILVG
jgi:hypothetical protein